MTPTIRVDQREFDATMRKLAANTSRSLDLFINSRAFHVGKKARDKTPIASREQISAELGATLVSEKRAKSGRMRRRYSYAPTKLVYALVNAQRKRQGLQPVQKGEMASAARKFIARRLGAIGSLKSGWSRAVGILGAAVRQSAPREGPRIKNPSTATPAKPGWNPQASLEYKMAVERRKGGGREILPEVVQALDGAFVDERGEMLQQLEKHMNKVAKQSGAI